MKKPLRHVLDYLLLTLMVSAGILLTLFWSGNPILQRIVIIGLSVLYFLWGVIHHTKEKTYNTQIGIEYALYALLGCVIVIGLF